MELLTQIREIFGAADMTEEQAAAAVKKAKADTVSLQTSLSAAKAENEKLASDNAKLTGEKPKVQDPEILRDRAEIAVGKIDLAVGKQEMPPVIASKLKEAVMKDGKPNAFLLTSVPELNGRPIDFISGLFAGEKLGGPSTGSKTGHQTLDRSVPGENEESKKQIEAGERVGKMHLDRALAQQEQARR